VSRGSVTLSAINLYKSLGGGWELREGAPFIAAVDRDEMQARTWWGDMLETREP
jgi:hypothetical protein